MNIRPKTKTRLINCLDNFCRSYDLLHQDKGVFLFSVLAHNGSKYILRLIDKTLLKRHDIMEKSLQGLMGLEMPVKISTYGYSRGFLVIKYDYFSGIPLRAIVRLFKGIPSRIALIVFIQLLFGLQSLFKENIRHSLLTPDNIFIEEGVVKFLDYGMAGNIVSPSMIRHIYNKNFSFVPDLLHTGETPDITSDLDNSLRILSFMLTGFTNRLSYDRQVIDALNINMCPFGTGPAGKVLPLSRKIIENNPDKDIGTIINTFLSTNILNHKYETNSHLFREILYKTRQMLLCQRSCLSI